MESSTDIPFDTRKSNSDEVINGCKRRRINAD